MELILWLQYCVSGLVLCGLCIIGLFGNTLTLYILNVNEDMRRQSINIYLTVLALYDNGVLLNAILMLGVPALYIIPTYKHQYITDFNATSSLLNSDQLEFNNTAVFYDNESPLSQNQIETTYNISNITNSPIENTRYSVVYNPLHLYIKIVYPLALISQTGSIWTTCLITAERYLAVCHPFKSLTLSTRSRAIWALIAVTICDIVFNLPRFAEIDMTDEHVGQSSLRKNRLYYWLYYICLNLTFFYIIPLSLLTFLNIKIYLAVRSASCNRGSLTRSQERELNLASMLVLLVAIFLACNAPAFVVHCLELVNPPYLGIAVMFSNLLVCLNSSVNFLIYCIFGKKFREKLKEVFKCKKKRKPRKTSSTHRHYYFGGSFVADTFV